MDQAQQLRNVIKRKNQKITRNTARVLTVTSGKGGVGKSNVAVNLAIQLKKMGKRVIIFDADFGLANVEVMFGAIPKYNLSDLIYHDKNISEILTKGPMDIEFISGGSGIIGLNNLTKEQVVYLVRCMEELESMADVIIVDTGAGISDHVMEFVLASPEVLLVTTPDPTSLTDSYSLLKALYHSEEFIKRKNKIRVISNRVSSPSDGQAVFDKLDSVVRQFLEGNISYLGMVPSDSALERSVRQQKPVSISYPNAKSSLAFEKLAIALTDSDEESVFSKWRIARLFDHFMNR